MKKLIKLGGVIVLTFCFAGVLLAQIPRPNRPFKIEVGLNFGSTLGYRLTDSFYDYGSWEAYYFDIDSEYGEILPELSTPLSIGGNISFLTNRGIGVQLALDYNFNSDMTGISTYNASGYDYYYEENINEGCSWNIAGTAKLMVLSLNLIYQYQKSMFSPWISAGASYYSGEIEGSSIIGFGFEDDWGDFDYIGPYADVIEDLSGVGFNVGGGLDIHFSPNTAFTVEARYFILKEYLMAWYTDVSGEFESYIWDITYTVDRELGDYMDELIDPFEFNPSFLKLAVGVKVLF